MKGPFLAESAMKGPFIAVAVTPQVSGRALLGWTRLGSPGIFG
jgi:hypothetical protein